MCGIIAAFDKKKHVNEDVLLQLEDQSTRGTNGFGSMFIEPDGEFSLSRATGQIKAIVDVKLMKSNMIIMHHRQPTSSKNKISQTHPIKISAGDLKHDYYFVHNGVIYSHADRKLAQESLGYIYSTEVEVDGWYDKKEMMYNDSEALGYDIARFIEGQTNVIETTGSAAFIITQVNKKSGKVKNIFYGRNSGNPLKLAQTRGYIFLSSEGKGEEIPPDMLYSFKLSDFIKMDKFKTNKKKMVIPINEPRSPLLSPLHDKSSGDTNVSTVKRSIGFDDYEDDYVVGRINPPAKGSFEREWMTDTQELELEGHFDEIQADIDSLKDSLLEPYGDELYMIEAKDTLRSIAIHLNQAIRFAQETFLEQVMDGRAEAEAGTALDTELDTELDTRLDTELDEENAGIKRQINNAKWGKKGN